MSDDFAFRLGPVTFIVVALAISLLFTWLGYAIGRRIGMPKNQEQAAALHTSLASIFVIVGLILSFSFSFAVNRYEDRWNLMVREADAIFTTDLRAVMLAPPDRSRLRAYLQRYLATKIDYYSQASDDAQWTSDLRLLGRLQLKIWSTASGEADTRRTVGPILLDQSVNTMLELGADQRAAFAFRLSGSALVLIVIVSLTASFLIGLGFGQSGSQHWLVSVLFSVLIVALVYVIVDLDNPRGGFIRVNVAPLVEVQRELLGS